MIPLPLAYFDPGSGSLLLQLLVGGGAGILVFGKLLWQAVRARWQPLPRQPDIIPASSSSATIRVYDGTDP